MVVHLDSTVMGLASAMASKMRNMRDSSWAKRRSKACIWLATDSLESTADSLTRAVSKMAERAKSDRHRAFLREDAVWRRRNSSSVTRKLIRRLRVFINSSGTPKYDWREDCYGREKTAARNGKRRSFAIVSPILLFLGMSSGRDSAPGRRLRSLYCSDTTARQTVRLRSICSTNE